ncbi:flagellar protein FlgN [Litorivicinus sp.]|nr:flagellar protein FlgN [Litorivicinus sp.]
MHAPDLKVVLQHASRLNSLLTDEFEALKTQKLDAFESLQQEKIDLLQALSESGISRESVTISESDSLQATINDPLWGEIIGLLEKCKRAHQRNELLISKQLDAIKGALATLQNHDPSGTLELYTKLGVVKSARRSILSGDA